MHRYARVCDRVFCMWAPYRKGYYERHILFWAKESRGILEDWELDAYLSARSKTHAHEYCVSLVWFLFSAHIFQSSYLRHIFNISYCTVSEYRRGRKKHTQIYTCGVHMPIQFLHVAHMNCSSHLSMSTGKEIMKEWKFFIKKLNFYRKPCQHSHTRTCKINSKHSTKNPKRNRIRTLWI